MRNLSGADSKTALAACLLLLGLACPVAADEPTLARLSFWTPPERMEEFGAAYAEQIAPLLKKHGLVASSEEGRTTVDSVFSRLFAFETPTLFASQKEILWRDSAWHDLRQRLGENFRTEPDSLIRCEFVLYQCPAGTGQSTPAGAGTRQGEWLNFGVQDGLPHSMVVEILQDRNGHLWFRIGDRRGLGRYDGATYTHFTSEDGLVNPPISMAEDRDGRLWFGTESGVSRYDGESFTYFTSADGLADGPVWDIVADPNGQLWFVTERGLVRYDGEAFTTFTTEDGLVDDQVAVLGVDRKGDLWLSTGNWSKEPSLVRYDGKKFTDFPSRDGMIRTNSAPMLEDSNGHLWFVAYMGGLIRFDGRRFTRFNTENGLPQDQVWIPLEDREGYVWVNSLAGLSRYEGAHVSTFTQRDGFPSSFVFSVLQDRTGDLWFGTLKGLVHYDGKEWVTVTTEDGMKIGAHSIVEDRNGHLWFAGWDSLVTRYDGERFAVFPIDARLNATYNNTGMAVDRDGNLWLTTYEDGVRRFDGLDFASFTTADGLISNEVTSVGKDRAGNVWFSTREGVSKFDGKTFTTLTSEGDLFGGKTFTSFTRKGDLILNNASPIVEDRNGHMWFGGDGVVSRYDGEDFATFTTENGLKPGKVHPILPDRRGHLWFGIYGAGIVLYDGLVFQDLHHRDGLSGDTVHDLIQDRDGDFWIATDNGVTRYRPSTIPPSVRLTEIVADRPYGAVQELSLPSSQQMIQFSFQGRSFTTSHERMVYVYRLRGHEEEWKSTRQPQVRYADLPVGNYLFEVRAVDRDLNYSDPVAFRLEIHPPYRQLVLIAVLCLSVAGLVAVSGYAIKKRHDLYVELEEELQTAHEMQMGLMPAASPQIESLDLAGRCMPYNHVGGDFFQYFLQDGKLSICMADVTGHAMEAAVPVMMFSGILESEIEHSHTLENLFSDLNRILNHKLDRRTFVCFTMGEIELSDRTYRLANGGCPSPYHYRVSTGEVAELDTAAYPLGVRADTSYSAIETELVPGDYVVFCSDGIIEMSDPSGEFYGFERTAETIRRGCAEDLSAEALIDHLIGAVKSFAGDAPQGDDMTVVVLKVES